MRSRGDDPNVRLILGALILGQTQVPPAPPPATVQDQWRMLIRPTIGSATDPVIETPTYTSVPVVFEYYNKTGTTASFGGYHIGSEFVRGQGTSVVEGSSCQLVGSLGTLEPLVKARRCPDSGECVVADGAVELRVDNRSVAAQDRTVQEQELVVNDSDMASRLCSISPKQPAARRCRDWYPYYAGFTQRFVDALLAERLEQARFVVDPWSGSGTTTVACLKRGVASKGVDINPALTVIARARLMPKTCRGTIEQLLVNVLAAARTAGAGESPPDLLESWLSPGAAELVRTLRRAIHAAVDDDGEVVGGDHPGADDLSPMACFFYCALFGVVRKVLRRYGATNPMWLKYPLSYRHRARPSGKALQAELTSQVEYLSHRLCLSPKRARMSAEPAFQTGNATALVFDDDVFDGAVTSPPYATRVDYVKGTLPELAVLGASEEYVERLRSASTGSPKVKGSRRSDLSELKSNCGKTVLEAIASHGSKGSRSYYLPWMANYLEGLQQGLQELDRTVKSKCPICIVVQDSYYKEVSIPMQQIVIEMMSGVGRDLGSQYDYSAPNPRRQSAAAELGAGKTPENVETLLVFT